MHNGHDNPWHDTCHDFTGHGIGHLVNEMPHWSGPVHYAAWPPKGELWAPVRKAQREARDAGAMLLTIAMVVVGGGLLFGWFGWSN